MIIICKFTGRFVTFDSFSATIRRLVMSGISKISKINVVHATAAHSGSLFFFHGSGSTGGNLKEWIDILNKGELSFPHIKIVYPTAPVQPYTPANGMPSHVWFNRKGISNDVSEEVDSINSICKNAMELIDKEISQGIPYDRIVLAGFSMGGALALYLSYRYKLSFAGCCAMSSFLNKNSSVYQHLMENPEINRPPLLQFHGTADELVPFQWGEESYKNLKKLGVNAQFVPLNNVDHVLSKPEVDTFKKWLLQILPQK